MSEEGVVQRSRRSEGTRGVGDPKVPGGRDVPVKQKGPIEDPSQGKLYRTPTEEGYTGCRSEPFCTRKREEEVRGLSPSLSSLPRSKVVERPL